MDQEQIIDEKTVAAVEDIKNAEYSAEDIARIQEQMHRPGMMGRGMKTSGGNKFHASTKSRKARRQTQKASRIKNRPKK